MRNTQTIQAKIKSLPNSPGVYRFFNQNQELIYIGKAANLKRRVSSYFAINKNGWSRPIEQLANKIADLKIKKTDTVLEAYFLEQSLIKKYQPKYNILGKDDKSTSFLVITKEKFPRFLIKRQTDLYEFNQTNKKPLIKKTAQKAYRKIYGPYASKQSLLTALKILRKIFPYHNRPQKSEKGCLSFQIGLCPGPYAGKISPKDYQNNIFSIEAIINGGKKKLLKNLEKEMRQLAKEKQFEQAAVKRNQLFALQHIQDVALIKKIKPINSTSSPILRLEAYDISHLSGKNTVGSMIVFSGPIEKLQPEKSQYRKFKIKTETHSNDLLAMQEVLLRRFKNNWPRPDLILLDGGLPQLNMAQALLADLNIKIPLLAVAKGPKRKKIDLYKIGTVPPIKPDFIAQMRDEAHRFAISYHRRLRQKQLKSDLKLI